MAARDLIARATEKAHQEARVDLIARAVQQATEERAPLSSGAVIKDLWSEQDAPDVRRLAPEGQRQPDANAGPTHSRPVLVDIQKIDWARVRQEGSLVPGAERNRLTEEFRVLKQPLLALAMGEAAVGTPRANIIMVTSARPREGKSYVAINLAMSLASERGLNVLLIDADCHRPVILERLGLSAKYGLLEVLENPDLDLADALIRTDCPNLTVIGSGQRVSESTEMLASKEMAALMNEVSTRYSDRIIIIDTPPILATTEASVLARHVGQIVFVVEANVTGASVANEACALVGACKNISIVLNKRISGGNKTEFQDYYD